MGKFVISFKERLSLRIGKVKKISSPIIKFHSNFEGPSQTGYTGKFSGQSECSSFFYRTRKVDGEFFWKKSSSLLVLPNNDRLTPKLDRKNKNKFSTRF